MNGLKWFLFAFCDLGTVLDFAFVSEFLVATSLLEPAEVCRTELKPFLAIFGTSMRAKRCQSAPLKQSNQNGKTKIYNPLFPSSARLVSHILFGEY